MSEIERRFHVYVVTATLSIIVAVIAAIDTLLTSDFGQTYGYLKTGLNALAAVVVAPFVYKFLSRILLGAMRKSHWIKQRVLKKFYVEGTWAGYYYAKESDLKAGNVFFVVDYFHQDLSILKVIGESLTKDGGRRASWESKAAQISPDASRMIFVVECNIPSKNLKCDAVTDFTLVSTGSSKWPDIVSGLSTNVTTDKIESAAYTVRQKKVRDGIRLDTTEALKQARTFYDQDKKRLCP